ncbi:MAG: hypothetical protein ACREUU_03905 [Gammaproteobacteria bacterium]
MEIDYRHARLDDVSAVSTVWADAVNALNQRHGFGNKPLNPVAPNPYYAFALKEEPEGFWVAEDAGEVEQGVAIALERGMHIASPFLLMSTKPFGNWDSYLFHSPGLL